VSFRSSVSVIIPAYKSEPFITESVESCLDQSYPVTEIIVIDDGSPDRTGDLVEAIARRDGRVKVVRQSNNGVATARNRGLKLATGDLIVFHDADDRLLHGAIEAGVRAFEAHPECGYVHGRNRPIDDGGRITGEPSREMDRVDVRTTLEGNTLIPPSAGMFRRSAIDAVGHFRQELAPAEDYDLYIRLSFQFPAHCHNEVVVEYRSHGGNNSVTSPSRTLQALEMTLDAASRMVGHDPALRQSIRTGRQSWRGIMGPDLAYEVARSVKAAKFGHALRTFGLMVRKYPKGIPAYAAELAGKVVGTRRRPVVAHGLGDDRQAVTQ
jgi:glycosyltransferase involved in cell wall biosynthesis